MACALAACSWRRQPARLAICRKERVGQYCARSAMAFDRALLGTRRDVWYLDHVSYCQFGQETVSDFSFGSHRVRVGFDENCESIARFSCLVSTFFQGWISQWRSIRQSLFIRSDWRDCWRSVGMVLLVRLCAAIWCDCGATLDTSVLFNRNSTWLAKRIDYCSGQFDRLRNCANDLSCVAARAFELDTVKPITWIERMLHHGCPGSPFILESNRTSNRSFVSHLNVPITNESRDSPNS